jgi:hypothetical protein
VFLSAHVQAVAAFHDDEQGQSSEHDEANQNFEHVEISGIKKALLGGRALM